MIYEPDFWVAVAFVIFLVVLWRVGAHKSVAASLDDRTRRIEAELDEARRLKDEAAAVLAEYKRKQREAEAEAQAIVEHARTEAATLAAEAGKRVEEFVARRTKAAETKISQAEAQAVAEVRAVAADTAAKAAERILADTVKGKAAESVLSQSIKDIKARLD